MKLHRYANGDLFNKLPEELRNVIINTTVVSGHGWSNSSQIDQMATGIAFYASADIGFAPAFRIG